MQEKFQTLKKGQIFKSYREMCQYLNEEYLDGTAKTAQLKEWKRYIKFKVRKNKSIIIEEVLANPIAKVDKRTDGNNVIYSNLVSLILLDYLAKNMDKKSDRPYMNLSNTKLYEILGMCNQTYIIEFIQKYKQDELHKAKIKRFKEENNLTDDDMNQFYDRSVLKFNSILDKSIASLNRKSIVIVSESYIIKEFHNNDFNTKLKDTIFKKANELSKSEIDKLCTKFTDTETRFATVEEKSIITKVQRQVMDDLDIKDLFFAHRPQNIEKYYRGCTLGYLSEMNWCMCYRTKTFSFHESTLKSGMNLLEKEIEEIKAKRRKLNGLVKDAIDKKAVEIYHQTNDDLLEKLLNDENAFSFKDNYIEAQRIVSEFFMQLDETEKENEKAKK